MTEREKSRALALIERIHDDKSGISDNARRILRELAAAGMLTPDAASGARRSDLLSTIEFAIMEDSATRSEAQCIYDKLSAMRVFREETMADGQSAHHAAGRREGTGTGYAAFEAKALNGDCTAWGVEEDGAVVYEPMFKKATAARLAELCESMPDEGWEAHAAVLEHEGFSLEDPAAAQRSPSL